MKTIYRLLNTDSGEIEWCLKGTLKTSINAFRGKMKVNHMDELSQSPKTADLSDLADFVSDNFEIQAIKNESELVKLLNAAARAAEL